MMKFIKYYYAVFLLMIVTSCTTIQYVNTLNSGDRPGEILCPYVIDKHGRGIVVDVEDPPRIIYLNGLEKEIKYCAEQYRRNPFWGPVSLHIIIGEIPSNLDVLLFKWNKLCTQYNVPYLLSIGCQNNGNFVGWVDVKSKRLISKEQIIKEITISSDKLHLYYRYPNGKYEVCLFKSPDELLKNISSSLYMKKYAYKIILSFPNQPCQWAKLYKVLIFMNKNNLCYQIFYNSKNR